MRPRKKHNLEPRLANCAPVILHNSQLEQIASQFKNPALPLRLELGCGKGRFACDLARRHPEYNFVAVEREKNVAVIAAERAMRGGLPPPEAFDTSESLETSEAVVMSEVSAGQDAAGNLMPPATPLPNLRFLLGDADDAVKLFETGTVDRIYINFCDPWHKRRQYKNRLTYRERLVVFRRLLAPHGELHFKTDNYMLWHFSTFEFAAAFPAYFVTEDLHASDYAADNIMTEYEQYFSNLGQPIYSIRAQQDGGKP